MAYSYYFALHEAETSTGSSFAPARSDLADPVSCAAFYFVCQKLACCNALYRSWWMKWRINNKELAKNICFFMRLGVQLAVRLLLEAPSWLTQLLVPHFALYAENKRVAKL